jgi:hypothetical protein
MRERVRIGVTGLNSAGKTVFLTALIHALRQRGAIAGVSVVREDRLKGVERLPMASDDTAASFPYDANADALTGADGEPRWPPSTDRVAKAVLALRYRSGNQILRHLGDRALRVELVDYPGEWLLDVLLAQHDFAAWSRAVFQEMESPEAGPEAKAFLAYVNDLDQDSTVDVEEKARTAAELFRSYVRARRDATGRANRLHPGRFILPGPGMDVTMPALTFAPLPPRPSAAGGFGGLSRLRGLAGPRTLARTMAARFDSYRETIVRPFFERTQARLDRQVVLIDLLGHLARDGAGVPLLDGELRDLQEAMRIGRTWLPRWLLPAIDRVLYASTKADLVPADQHDVLLERMRKAVANASESARFRGADTRVMTLAALAATRDVSARDRPDRGYVAGRHADGNAYMHYPGELDRARPPVDASGSLAVAPFEIERFQPPAGLGRNESWPHRRLDGAIEYLIGDRLS